jgi:signal transduction histidine kinase
LIYLDRFDTKSKQFKPVRNDAFIRRTIFSINEDKGGDLWIGTANGGLFHCLDRENERFEQIKNEALGKERVRVIKKDQEIDQQGNYHFWIGTEGKGIVKFNPQTGRFSQSFSTRNENGLSDDDVYCILPDNFDDNILWVGTAKGLDKVDKNEGNAKPIESDNKPIRILSIAPDSDDKNILWLGSEGSGLCKVDKRQKKIITYFTEEDGGLPNNTVYGILPDSDKNLWFSTNHGISKFNPGKGKVIRNFDENDGLQANEFNSGAYLKSQSGNIYFGGIKGLSVFNPDEIELDDEVPRIYFTQLNIGDKKVKIGDEIDGKLIISKSITKTKRIELDYHQQPIRLEFAALDYDVPTRIKYKCELIKDSNEIDSKWISDNFYNFPNSDAGKYKFRVRSTNSDGYVDFKKQKPAEIDIVITRNWFDTWRPFLILVVLVVAAASLIVVTSFNSFKKMARRRIEQLKLIESAVNDVSGVENAADAIFRSVHHIVYSFGFDYGAISLINFLRSTITTVWGRTRKVGLIKPESWKQGLRCKLSEANVLTKVVKERNPIEVIYDNVKAADSDKVKSFNKEIFDVQYQNDLIRVFFPLEYRAKGKDIRKDKANMVFGVVEAGFHRNTRPFIPKEMKIISEVFLSYCANLFFRANLLYEKQIVDNLLKRSSVIEDHNKYLEAVLKDIVDLIGGDKGDISFFSFSDKEINMGDNPIFYNVESIEDRNLIKERSKMAHEGRGIVRHAAETNHLYYSNDVKYDPHYIEEFPEVNSELAVPMRYCDRVISVLNIYSKESAFFNDHKASIIQIISDEAAKIYQKKKINQTIKHLVLPFHFFTGIEEIYEIIIKSIKDYFITEYVSIWERSEKEGISYELITACNKLKEKYDEIGLMFLGKEIMESNKKEIYLIDFNNEKYLDCPFNEFLRKYDLRTMILVPIIVDQQVYGFINIFSKRVLLSLFPEDKTFLNLIATKGAISVQYEKLLSSFMDISNSLPSNDYEKILKKITDNAAKVLHADPVILYKYEKERGIFGATFSGSLKFPESERIAKNEENKREDHLAFYIMKNGSVWFETTDDYNKYIRKTARTREGANLEKDFWTREIIKSSAGIRLEHNKEPIGVMFFNYRNEQRFNKDTRLFIEAFASLASGVIVNAKYQNLIEMQNLELEKQSTQLQVQQEKLEFEYEEVHRKMTEMLPRATRTSFYLILAAVNHDIRNLLIRIKQATMDIRDNSDTLPEKVRSTIDKRTSDIERNIRNVSNLLKLFDFRNAGREEVDINSLTREITFFFQTKESDSIIFNTDNLNVEIPPITCNKAEFSMLIFNLLSNSVDAVEKKDHANGEIKISTDFRNDEYVIVVEDNGIGIIESNIPRIFEIGFTTKEKGLGIGLYFVNETLKKNFWGEIKCESQNGDWTRFTVIIPESVNYKEN